MRSRDIATTSLVTRRVEKPWGRHRLWPAFDAIAKDEAPVGEIWFETPDGPAADLLVKYLFTAETLSIQVHPGSDKAKAAGLPRGKDEAWLVLAADPGAMIGLGLRRPLTEDELRRSLLDGSIEREIAWRRAQAGNFFYLPAGTIHALGAGLTVIEIQQNVDITYRLYDHGRARTLHVEEAILAADLAPLHLPPQPRVSPGRNLLARGPAFVVEQWRGPARSRLITSRGAPLWLVPIAGDIRLQGRRVRAGQALMADHSLDLELGRDGDLLLAYPGSQPIDISPMLPDRAPMRIKPVLPALSIASGADTMLKVAERRSRFR